MTYTSQQIIIFDKILKFYYDHYCLHTEHRNPNNILFSEIFNIDKDLAQFCINEVCKNGKNLELLNCQKLGYGDYVVVKVNQIETENFMNKRGFEKHFKEKNIKINDTYKIHIGDNISNVDQLNKNEIKSSSDFTINPKYIKNKADYINTIIAIITLLITIIGTYIAYLQLK